jgi:predicted CoA-binding protein
MEAADGSPANAVIIVGASSDRSRFSNKAVRAYAEMGYRVYPVHPNESRVEGFAVSPSLSQVPGHADLLLLYVRPEAGLHVVGEAGAKGVKRIYVNPGTGSTDLVRRIRELGMEPIEACAIRALGKSPAQYPDS